MPQPSPATWRLGWEGISHQHDLQSALTLPSTSPDGCCRLALGVRLPCACLLLRAGSRPDPRLLGGAAGWKLGAAEGLAGVTGLMPDPSAM